MSETLGEIQERLRPDHLIQQAKDSVTEAATGKVRNIMHSAGETATTRPSGRAVPATTWRGTPRNIPSASRSRPAWSPGGCCAAAASSSELWYGASDTSWDYDEYVPIEPSLRDRASVRRVDRARGGETDGRCSTPRRRARRSANTPPTARDTVNEYAQSAASTARMRVAARPPRGRHRHVDVDDWVHDNPLAAGADCGGRRRGDRPRRARRPTTRIARWARRAIRRWRRRSMSPTT